MSSDIEKSKSIPDTKDPKILNKLRGYDEHSSILCLECGYEGLMGVEGKRVPWYLTWWVLIPICLTGIGIVPAFLLGFLRYSLTKERVRCPNCGSQLGTK